MYFLLSGCQNPDILRLILLAKKILDIAFIIIPIGLIVFIVIDLFKMMIAGEDKGGKNVKLIINRVIFAVLIFFVPTIVSFIMNTLSNAGVDIGTDYTTCLNNANKSTIAHYQRKQDEEEKIKKDKAQLQQQIEESKKPDTSNKNPVNTTPTGELYHDIAQQMIFVAVSELNNKDGSKYSTYWGGTSNEPWCAAFVMWVADNTNVEGFNLYKDIFEREIKIPAPRVALSATYTFNESSHLTFYDSESQGGSYTPKTGDLVFIDRSGTWNKNDITSNEGTANSHVAIVKTVFNDKGTIETIDGNYDGKVSIGNYYLNDKAIVGYGAWYR